MIWSCFTQQLQYFQRLIVTFKIGMYDIFSYNKLTLIKRVHQINKKFLYVGEIYIPMK